MKVFLLDNGHGQDTPGKRSPVWPDGSQLFEWSFNRDMVARIKERAVKAGLLVVELVPEKEDVPLSERCARANKWHNATNGRAVLLSMHANAGGGSGFEVYTSRGSTKEDNYASVIYNALKTGFPGFKVRPDMSDGDVDKEANFYVLTHTYCPAILCENLFMDNREDCLSLLSADFREKLAEVYVGAMLSINNL